MSEGMSHREIMGEHDKFHAKPHNKHSKHKALKHALTGRSQKEQMRFKRQNRSYQEKFGRAWND